MGIIFGFGRDFWGVFLVVCLRVGVISFFLGGGKEDGETWCGSRGIRARF